MKTHFVILLLSLSIVILYYPLTREPEYTQSVELTFQSYLSDLTPSGSIYIESDSDFVSGGYLGSGTAEQPYVISGYNVTADPGKYAIYISGTVTCHYIIEGNFVNGTILITKGIGVVRNCEFVHPPVPSSTTAAVFVAGDNMIVESNHFWKCSNYSIWVDNVNDVIIRNNTVDSSTDRGIFIFDSNDVLVEDNTLLGTEAYPSCQMDVANCLRPIIKNNTVYSDYIGISVTSEASQAIDNTFYVYGGVGLEIGYRNNLTVKDCCFEQMASAVGLRVGGSGSSHAHVSGCTFNGMGMIVGMISHVSISDCTAMYITVTANHYEVFNNTLSRSYSGIGYGSTVLNLGGKNGSIFLNTFESINGYAVIDATCDESRIYNNTITNGHRGLLLSSGAENNSIYYNRIFNNTINGEDDGTGNIWDDNVSFGNYWDDAVMGQSYSVGNVVDRWPVLLENNPPEVGSVDVAETGTNWAFIEASVSDETPCKYWFYFEGDLIDSGPWDGSDISLNITLEESGAYNVTLVLLDMNNNKVSHYEEVTINLQPPTTTTTTTTITTTTTDLGLDPTLLMVGAVAVVAIIVVAGVVIIKRRK
jgi:parallel beta-helix repeat protein